MYNPWPQILSRFRREQGHTQEDAAEAARVSRLTWHRWETGKLAPNPCQLEDLAAGLKLSEDELGYMYATAVRYHYAGSLAAAVANGSGGADLKTLETMAGVPSGEDGEMHQDLFVVLAKMAGPERIDEVRSALDTMHSTVKDDVFELSTPDDFVPQPFGLRSVSPGS